MARLARLNASTRNWTEMRSGELHFAEEAGVDVKSRGTAHGGAANVAEGVDGVDLPGGGTVSPTVAAGSIGEEGFETRQSAIALGRSAPPSVLLSSRPEVMVKGRLAMAVRCRWSASLRGQA